MFARLRWVLALTMCVVCVPASAHAAVQPRRIVVMVVSPDTVGGWQASPPLASLLDQGAAALLSTRTARDESAALRLGAAMATLGNGTRSSAGDRGSRLAEMLVPAGIPMVASPALEEPLAASSLRARLDAIPHAPSLSVIDARADAGLVASARAMLDPADLLIVLAPLPAPSRVRAAIHLGVIAMVAGEIPRGVLGSATTRRAGVVALVDVMPTIVSAFGLAPPRDVEGRPITITPRPLSARTLAGLERDVVEAARARRPLTRGALIVAMIVMIAALGAGPPMRRAASVVLLAATASPLALYVVGAAALHSVTLDAVFVVAVSLGLAAAARWSLGFDRALLIVAGLTALVPLVDLIAGTPIGARSPLAFQIAGGGRFYGVDDGVLGVVVAAVVLAVALWLDRARDRTRAAGAGALVLAASVWVLASPSFGAKFGAPLTAVPMFGVFAVLASGRPLRARAGGAIAVLTVAITGLFVLIDRLGSESTRSHVARALGGETDTGNIVSRKIAATWHITVYNIWSRATVVFVLVLLYVWLRRRPLFERAFAGRRAQRAAWVAIWTGAVVGFALNDDGIITTTLLLLVAAPAIMGMVLERAP